MPPAASIALARTATDLRLFTAVAVVTALLSWGCEEAPHACLWMTEWGEYGSVQYDNPTEYHCNNVYGDDACPEGTSSGFGITRTIEEVDDESCEDLGYSTQCGESSDYYAGNDCSSGPNQVPGDRIAGQDSGGTGGSGGSCGEYTDRGLDDIQIKSHCQTAWSYSCQGNSQGVQASCGILDRLTVTSVDGSNPKDKCPYCD